MDFIPHIYDSEEAKDIVLFKEFASHNTWYYKDWKESESGTFFDLLSQNATGGTSINELKYRDNAPGEDLFIEPEKFVNMTFSYTVDGFSAVYINFMKGWKDVYLFRLEEVKDVKFYPRVYIKGNFVPRFGIDKGYAYHYVWNEETQKYDLTMPTLELNSTNQPSFREKTIFDEPINNNNYLRSKKKGK